MPDDLTHDCHPAVVNEVAMIERKITARMLELANQHAMHDPTCEDALARIAASDNEIRELHTHLMMRHSISDLICSGKVDAFQTNEGRWLLRNKETSNV